MTSFLRLLSAVALMAVMTRTALSADVVNSQNDEEIAASASSISAAGI